MVKSSDFTPRHIVIKYTFYNEVIVHIKPLKRDKLLYFQWFFYYNIENHFRQSSEKIFWGKCTKVHLITVIFVFCRRAKPCIHAIYDRKSIHTYRTIPLGFHNFLLDRHNASVLLCFKVRFFHRDLLCMDIHTIQAAIDFF